MNFNSQILGCIGSGTALILLSGCTGGTDERPNILFCIADDASYPHMGREAGWINTPGFDRVAEEGLLFSSAYTPNAKSAPSRSSLLTGRNSWQLEEAANHFCYFPSKFITYPEVLGENGYHVGYTGKGWLPGDPGTVNGEPRALVGKEWNTIRTKPPTRYISAIDYSANFEAFYNAKPGDKPFCFWYGGHEPHRRYEYGSSIEAGKQPDDIDVVPGFLPDVEEVRTDLLDYALEIEYFDSHLQDILAFLEEKGDLENTIVVVTADNGMPFPRAKSDEYEYSNHVPLAIMWEKGIRKAGRTIHDYISFVDLAPTFLDVSGITWSESGMYPTPGKSLSPLFRGRKSKHPFNEFVLIGKERHDVGRPDDLGYPIRGIVRNGWLYLKNYRTDLWPAGNPQTGYPTVGGSPTKTWILENRKTPEKEHFWNWSFGKRPVEELYHIKIDPFCLVNLADSAEYDSLRSNLINIMEDNLRQQEDPRMFGKGDIFQKYIFSDERWRNGYEKIVIQKKQLVFPWINASDIDPDFEESGSDSETEPDEQKFN
jgi:N-sulfoglucosamine sulfohydrolase